MALIKCSECGKKISDKALACPKCGAPVSVGGDYADNSSTKDNEQQTAKKNSSLVKLFIILDILALLGIGIYFLTTTDLLNNLIFHNKNNISETVDTGDMSNTTTETVLQAFIITEPTGEPELTTTTESYNENNIIDTDGEDSSKVINGTENTDTLMEQVTAEIGETETTTQQSLPNSLVLKEGDRNDDVRDLQIKLRDIGIYTGIIDGSFGMRTRTAVITLQEMYNLTPDGIVSDETWTALYDAWRAITADDTQQIGDNAQSVNKNESDITGTDEENTTESETDNVPQSIGLNGMEITFHFGKDITLDKVNNIFSEHNGETVFRLPVVVKNLKSEPDRLSQMNITQYGLGEKLADIGNDFDDIRNTDIVGGESVNGYIYFLYKGNGIYSIDFEQDGKNYKVDFSLGDINNYGEASDYTLTID